MTFSQFNDFTRCGQSLTYRLTGPLSWEVGRKGSGYTAILQPGTHFDISVPGWLTFVQSPHDRQLLPCAALHDELLNRGFDAAFASSEFRRAAIARGIRPFRAWALFFATLAWTAFKRRKSQTREEDNA